MHRLAAVAGETVLRAIFQTHPSCHQRVYSKSRFSGFFGFFLGISQYGLRRVFLLPFFGIVDDLGGVNNKSGGNFSAHLNGLRRLSVQAGHRFPAMPRCRLPGPYRPTYRPRRGAFSCRRLIEACRAPHQAPELCPVSRRSILAPAMLTANRVSDALTPGQGRLFCISLQILDSMAPAVDPSTCA